MKDNKKLNREPEPEHVASLSAGCASQRKINRVANPRKDKLKL